MKIQINETGTYYVVARNTTSGYKSVNSNTVTFFSLNKCYRTIRDVFPDPYNNGFFKLLVDSGTGLGDFLNRVYPEAPFDIEYIFKRSGSKRISSLLEGFFETRRGKSTMSPLSDKQIKMLCNIFSARYYEKWTKLYDTLVNNFNPFSPYKMTISDTTKDNLKSNESAHYNDNSSNDNSVYGFNASDPTPTSKDSGTGSGNSTNEKTRTSDISRAITREGNIGNVTMQQLTQQQREMLQWQFWDVIFTDTDKLLTRPSYS